MLEALPPRAEPVEQVAGGEPDSDAEKDQHEQRDSRREEHEADVDLLAVEENDQDRVHGQRAEKDELPGDVPLGPCRCRALRAHGARSYAARPTVAGSSERGTRRG